MVGLLRNADYRLRLIDLLRRDVVLGQQGLDALVIVLSELKLSFCRGLCSQRVFDCSLSGKIIALRGRDSAVRSGYSRSRCSNSTLFSRGVFNWFSVSSLMPRSLIKMRDRRIGTNRM